MKILLMKIFNTRHKVNLASNTRVAQVFKATVYVFHSHHPLRSVLGRDFSCESTGYIGKRRYSLSINTSMQLS